MITLTREKMDAAANRAILRGMATDTAFLARVSKVWFKDMFSTPAERTLASWCVNHLTKYNEAPGTKLEALFAHAVRQGEIPQQQAEVLGTLMQSLGADAPQGSDMLYDITLKYIRQRKLQIVAEDIQAHLSKGETDKADSIISNFRAAPTSDGSAYYDLMGSSENTRRAFDHSTEPMFHFYGHLDNILSPLFTPDSLVSILAPEKRGKTFWLVDIMLRALSYNKRVAVFTAGDMTAPQFDLRVTTAVAGKNNRERYSGVQLYPVWDCLLNRSGTCPMRPQSMVDLGGVESIPYDRACYDTHKKRGYTPCSKCKDHAEHHGKWKWATWFEERDMGPALTWDEGLRAKERFMGPCTITKRVRLSAHPTFTLKVSQIQQILKSWYDTDGFSPDVIIIDYADILAPEKDKGQHRDEINETWGRMRALGQTLHASVVTATQGNREAAIVDDLTIDHFSDDKRKRAHVTGMFALNQTPFEKAMMLYRISTLYDRDNSVNPDDQALCLGPIFISRPCVDCIRVRRNVTFKKKE